MHLSQQRGCKIGLIAYRLYAARFLHYPTQPKHRYLILKRIGVVHAFMRNAVVWQKYHKCVVPSLRCFQLAYEIAYALVKIAEGILYLVVEFLQRHIPRFMTRQC